MTEPRYTAPVPPYQPTYGQGTPQAHGTPHGQGPVLSGVVVDGPGTRRPGNPGQVRFVRQKSLLLAGLLAFFFPPIGMLYATFFGTLVMIVVGVPALLLTAGHASAVLWPICVVWAVWAAHRKNQRRLAWAAMGF